MGGSVLDVLRFVYTLRPSHTNMYTQYGVCAHRVRTTVVFIFFDSNVKGLVYSRIIPCRVS